MLVSKQIQLLETALGARLLHRSTREVSLTDAGLAYLEPCSASVEQAQQARLAVSEAGNELAGGLRIQAPNGFSSLWLADALARFALLHPRLQPTLHADNRLLDPFKHGFDLSIRVGGIPDTHGLQMRRLTRCRAILCASPAYLAQHGQPEHPEQLRQHRCLHFSHLPQSNSWHLTRDGQTVSVDLQPSFSSNNGQVLHQVALRGLGIVYDTTFLAWRDVLEGRLIPVLRDWQLPLNDFTALYPASRQVSAKVRSLIDFLLAEYAPEAEWDRALRAAGWLV